MYTQGHRQHARSTLWGVARGGMHNRAANDRKTVATAPFVAVCMWPSSGAAHTEIHDSPGHRLTIASATPVRADPDRHSSVVPSSGVRGPSAKHCKEGGHADVTVSPRSSTNSLCHSICTVDELCDPAWQ